MEYYLRGEIAKKAVKGGKALNKRDRYHHPEMSIEDMNLKNKMR